MSDQSLFDEIVRAAGAGATMIAVIYGAAGGLSSALLVKENHPDRRAMWRDLRRQVVLGALFAGGVGSGGAALLYPKLGLSPEAVATAGAGGAAFYLIGLFGPAFAKVVLARARRGQLPGETKEARDEAKN